MNKWCKTLLIAISVAVVLLAIPHLLSALISWLERPVQIGFAAKEQTFLSEKFGIDLPGEGCFVDGYQYPGRDPTTLYIFEFTSERELDEASAEAFVRSQLSLDERFYSARPVSEAALFGVLLAEEGLEFTHYFGREDIGSYWIEVFYHMEGKVAQVAVVYCAP